VTQVDDPRRSERLMMGTVVGEPALGRGPKPNDDYSQGDRANVYCGDDGVTFGD
jgi:hypothetical protein